MQINQSESSRLLHEPTRPRTHPLPRFPLPRRERHPRRRPGPRQDHARQEHRPQAILAGHSALFTTAADLLLDLSGQETAPTLERRLKHYTRPALLAIDEVGYLAYDARAADLIFQLVSRRYERRPLLITTNLLFKHWDTVFPNASCAVALIDRLTHHVEILVIEGQSYRRREAELTRQQRSRKRPSRKRAADNGGQQ